MFAISPATLDDVSALADLLALLFAQEADFSPDREKQVRGVQAILSAPRMGVVFAAREASRDAALAAGQPPRGSEVIGMASLLFTISTSEGGPACWLEDVVVRPDRRGAGVGSALLGHAIAFARDEGYLRISLQTDWTNPAARRLYQRHGFEASEMTTLRLRLDD